MILNTNIKDNKKTIEFDIDGRLHDVRYIYLDTYENSKKYLSPDDRDHSYKLTADQIFVSESLYRSVYEIKAEQLNLNKFIGLYILTVVFDDGEIEHRIIYDLNELYCVRFDYLTKTCLACNDTANYNKLTILMFKEMMLRNYIAMNNIEKSLEYYNDIFKPYSRNNKVMTCISGMCKFC